MKISIEDLIIVTELPEHDKLLLRRLPSVQHRNINVEQLFAENKFFAAKHKKNGKLLLITFYHEFGDFTYAHTTIGRDEVKEFVSYPYLKAATKTAPCYSIMFNSEESTRNLERLGGKRISISEVEKKVPTFIENVNKLTGSRFYKSGQFLFDHNDPEEIDNPIYIITKETFIDNPLFETKS
ncbi:hypothetical protein [Flammeovirga sp. OC4]|uniref:hypothetical protein n=1 Tax=Flammeovirga sp. OC4 TaxID=1382345 RepID=UPI0005C61A51|nr:hypothetical protein [Flammeovirga sp. OC4]